MIFIITLIFNLVFNTLTNDEVWNYGFAYNISRGLIPYKDFNMVITPLYPMINALFMIIFGKNILIMHIINAILCTAIFYFLKKTTSKAYYILYSILLFFALPNYNIMCLLFLYILIMLEKQKSNDYLIGIILGLTFMTKQNVGIYLCIPTIFTKDIKRILKRIIGFMIPNILIFTYLIYNKAVYEFINYCFLGLSNFGEKNFGYYKTTTIILISMIWKKILMKC